MFDTSPTFISRNKAVSSRLQSGGVYIGIITRVAAEKVYVRVPKLGGKVEYGPCLFNGVSPAIDDRVLVGFLDNQLSEMVVFGTLGKPAAGVGDTNFLLSLKANIDSPNFTGIATAPTPSTGDSSSNIATTEFVKLSSQPLRKVRKEVTTTSYEIIQTDEQKIIECNATSAMSVYVGLDAFYNIQDGTEVHLLRIQSAAVTIIPGAGVLLNGAPNNVSIRAPYSMVTLIKRATNNWVIVGDYS